MIDGNEFNPEPTTDRGYLAALWRDMKFLKAEVKETNGRVHRLERIVLVASAFGLGYVAKDWVPAIITLLR